MQAVQIVRRRRPVTNGKVTLERVYGVTDLTAEQAETTEIARRVRDHWGIENKIHHVRDTTYAEDTSRVRTGTVPWRPCATWPSALSDSAAGRTSPLDSATTPATPTVH